MMPTWVTIKRALAAPAGALSVRLAGVVIGAFAVAELLRPILGAWSALVGVALTGAGLYWVAVVPCRRTHERLLVTEHQRERLATISAAVARIAHDLRNSLATAQLISGRLEESEDPRVRMAAPRMERAIARAVSLAEAASRYGKAEQVTPAPRPVPLQALLSAPVAASRKAAPDVAVDLALGGETVLADPDLSFRIFDNLLRNAATAIGRTQREGRIRIESAREGGHVRVDIHDDGPGLSEAARERLFQPFAVDDGSSGAGLGLAVAREFARLQGGDVQLLRSDAPGAAFRVTLPAV